MAKAIYYIQLFAKKCIVEVIVNGLLVTKSNAKNGSSLNYPINTELIGLGNEVKISVYPTLLDSGEITNYKDVAITGTIKKYSPTDVVCPESGDLITEFDFTNEILQKDMDALSIKELKDLFPITKNIIFDNEDISFRSLFLESQKITDTKMILDYGEYLRDLLKNKDVEKLFYEYRHKLQDYKTAYESEQFNDIGDFFVQFMEGDFLPGGPVTNFKRDDIGLRSWCGGRIWELFIKPDREFFSNIGLDGDINTVEVFVCLIDNKLKIIR
jgi:hypothetical protein